ncbi:esterase/lipase family protein [Nocardia brasiliensis]|uniref:esterase/lipase family protein n=1 Tax=Nocardia brasiliensis TaxID=37326 RepID=UPI002458A44A|nr:alpha/beta fold hydrolase [Nocardia brasiliensis]
MKKTVVVFVHGLFSSGKTWRKMQDLLAGDPELEGLNLLNFTYDSPKLNINPLRRIPDFDVLAASLQTCLETEAADHSCVILVSHSQGGLIVQRYLARMVLRARATELARIRKVVMFACPNAGSDMFLGVRRVLLRCHPHVKALRPINAAVSEAQAVILERIVFTKEMSDHQYPVQVRAYGCERDRIVKPGSALWVFPNTGMLKGGHSSIIKPKTPRDRSYLALKHDIITAVAAPPLKEEPSAIPDSFKRVDATAARGTIQSAEAAAEMLAARMDPESNRVRLELSPETFLFLARKIVEEPPR